MKDKTCQAKRDYENDIALFGKQNLLFILE